MVSPGGNAEADEAGQQTNHFVAGQSRMPYRLIERRRRVFAERGQYAQAKATFESIRDGYEPESGADDIADSVRMRLERLSSLMQE